MQVLLLILAALLASCTSNPSPQSNTKHEITRSGDEYQVDRDIREIAQLLEDAEYAISQRRLTTPTDNNAHDRLLRVLALDPQNGAAINLINRIVETYI